MIPSNSQAPAAIPLHPKTSAEIDREADLPSQTRSTLRRRYLSMGVLIFVCLFLFFWHLGNVPLFDLDEGLYATSARQMAVSGDWITPRLNSRMPDNPSVAVTPFFEKPILIYWLAAGSLRLFGISEWAVRLPVPIAALLTTLVIALVGTRWFGHRAGLLAGLVYATAPLTLVDARQLTTDSLLVLWYTVAMFAFWGCRRAARQRRLNNSANSVSPSDVLFPLLFWTMCALAVLTKGVVGLLLPILVITAFLTIDRLKLFGRRDAQRRPILGVSVRLERLRAVLPSLRALWPVVGLALFLLIIAPWHLLIWRVGERDGLGHTWFQEYIIRQHVGRFKGLDTVHNMPMPTYILYFLLGFFPWATFVPAAFRYKQSHRPAPLASTSSASTDSEPTASDLIVSDPMNSNPNAFGLNASAPIVSALPHSEDAPRRYLLVWFWTIFIFFSLSAAKLPNYIAPAYPAAALLVGRWLDRILFADADSSALRSLRRGALTATLTGGLLLLTALIGPRFVPANAPIPAEVISAVQHLVLIMTLGSACAWVCFRQSANERKRRQAGIASLAVMMLLLVGFGCSEGYSVAGRDVLAPYQQLAADARPDAEKGLPILFYDIIPRRPSMLFYARYSPLEAAPEKPGDTLMQYLSSLTPEPRELDIITSKDAYDRLVLPEVEDTPGATASLLKRRGAAPGGWVLARLHLPTR